MTASIATSWFLAVSASGAACAALALVVMVVGWRRNVPEVAILGTALFCLSAMATSYGLSVTSVGGGTPSEWAALLGLPLAAGAALPLKVPHTRFARLVAGKWQLWVVLSSAAALLVAGLLVRSSPRPSGAVIFGFGCAGVAGGVLLARRQLYLHRVSGLPSARVAALAVLALTLSWLVMFLTTPGSAGSWVLLAMENLGVFATGIAAVVGYRSGRGVVQVLAPIVAREPLAALELGMAPEIRAFVAALDRKDPVTRDHVVRTSALALRTALRAGMSPEAARDVALGALLHDIGKLVMPDGILNKPAALTGDEFATIRTHPVQGERLLLAAPSLRNAAPYVRGHHERVDGQGYPDGLAGDEVSFPVGLVSVADAWDAMTHTRQYRKGMDPGRAKAILEGGAGTQWRADAVELLLIEIRLSGHADLQGWDAVARADLPEQPLDTILADCACLDAIPQELMAPPSAGGLAREVRPVV